MRTPNILARIKSRLPTLSKPAYDLQTLRGDIFGGVTSAVVGLPTALAFGVASGIGAIYGLYGAIVGGFFAAVFGGTRSQISGPTPSMAVAMAVIVGMSANNLTEAFTIVILAGLIQILLGVVGIGRFIAFTPYSVVSGFMTGIGAIIILLQTLPFLGANGAGMGPNDVIRAIPAAVEALDPGAVAIAAASLIVAIVWPPRVAKFFPPVLAALIAGTALSVFLFPGTPVIGAVPSGLPSLSLPEISPTILARAAYPAVTIALLGSIDSLLTSLVADSMTRTSHNPNRELIGQGLGNTVVGMLSAVPGAGATMGTVVNIRAGGRTQLSGVFRSVILLALALGLGRYVEVIPHAALAGILMKVGYDIIDWRFITRIHRIGKEHLIVMFVTLGMTIFVDLITAVAVGLVVAAMSHARQFELLELDRAISTPLLDSEFLGESNATDSDPFAARVGLVALRGAFTIASSNLLVNTIAPDIGDHEVVILDFSETVYMDDSAALVVERLIDTANDHDTPCIIIGLSEELAGRLNSLKVLDSVPQSQKADTLEDARPIAQRLLED